MDSSSPPRSASVTWSVDRRTVLAVCAGVGAAALAGCSRIADFVAGVVLKDVNVINGTDREIAGAIEVADPDDEVVLDESFDLQASQESDGTGTPDGGDGGDGQPSEEASGLYGDVFTGEGEYDVAVTVDESTDFDAGSVEETVEVTAPDDEHIFVFFGSEDGADEIIVTVADGLSDLEELDGS